jgi:hypothetical protein
MLRQSNPGPLCFYGLVILPGVLVPVERQVLFRAFALRGYF